MKIISQIGDTLLTSWHQGKGHNGCFVIQSGLFHFRSPYLLFYTFLGPTEVSNPEANQLSETSVESSIYDISLSLSQGIIQEEMERTLYNLDARLRGGGVMHAVLRLPLVLGWLGRGGENFLKIAKYKCPVEGSCGAIGVGFVLVACDMSPWVYSSTIPHRDRGNFLTEAMWTNKIWVNSREAPSVASYWSSEGRVAPSP